MNLPIIYLLRHGQTEWNVEGRYQGQLDSPLTEKGKLQAKENALKISKYIDINTSKLYASPLTRARDTAYILAEALEIKRNDIIFEENLKEINYGIFEGKTKEYCRTKLSREFEAREMAKYNYVLEGGESYEMVEVRLREWLKNVEKEKMIVVIAHEMINRALRGIYSEMKKDEMLMLRQSNDVLIKLENGKEDILD